MNSLRAIVLIAVSMVAACSTAPSKPTAAPATPAAPAALNIAGNWTVNVDSQFGPFEQKMTVIQAGKEIKGTLVSQMGSVDYTGTIDGNNVKFGFNYNAQGTDLHIDYVGTTDGKTMSGKAVFGSFGDGTFKGAKQ
jgi:hypothetical protein